MQTGPTSGPQSVALAALNNALSLVNNTLLAGGWPAGVRCTLVLAGGAMVERSHGLTLRDLTVLWRKRGVRIALKSHLALTGRPSAFVTLR